MNKFIILVVARHVNKYIYENDKLRAGLRTFLSQ